MINIFIGLGILILFILIIGIIGIIIYNINNIKTYLNGIFKEYIQNFTEIIIKNENKHENNNNNNEFQKYFSNEIQKLINTIKNIYNKFLSLIVICFILYVLKDIVFFILSKFDKLLKE